MRTYQGIVIAKDVYFGVVPVFYASDHKELYDRDAATGRLADNKLHDVLDATWLAHPVDYINAEKIADAMMRGVKADACECNVKNYNFSSN